MVSITSSTNVLQHFFVWYFYLEISLSFNVSTVTTKANSVRRSLSDCNSYDENIQSFCVSFDDCPRMLELVKSPDKTKEEIRLLQKMTCGFILNEPLICCPYYDILLKTNYNENEDRTPTPSIVFPTSDHDVRPEVADSRERYKSSSTTRKPLFGTTQKYHLPKPYKSDMDHPNFSLIPPLKECGNIGTGNRIIGGDNSVRGSHPWIVRVGYTSLEDDVVEFGCAGTIINNRYILTAAHCISERANYKLSTIRVGEHNMETDYDCEDEMDTGIPCSTFEDYEISESFGHPNYKSGGSSRRMDDIALIRVDREINFTACIVSPICLPFWGNYELGERFNSMNLTQFDNKKGLVSGWGVRKSESQAVDILQEILIPIVPTKECQKIFDQKSIKASISDKQMCVGGVIGKSACIGDSGGPVTFPTNVRSPSKFVGMKFFQLGIVSFGLSPCSGSGVPTVFTRLTAYNNWILDNISP